MNDERTYTTQQVETRLLVTSVCCVVIGVHIGDAFNQAGKGILEATAGGIGFIALLWIIATMLEYTLQLIKND